MSKNLSHRLCASESMVLFRGTVRQTREVACVPCFAGSLGSSQPSPSAVLVFTPVSNNLKSPVSSTNLQWPLMPKAPKVSQSPEKVCSDCWRTWERQGMWDFLGYKLDRNFMVCATVREIINPERRAGPLPLAKRRTNAPSHTGAQSCLRFGRLSFSQRSLDLSTRIGFKLYRLVGWRLSPFKSSTQNLCTTKPCFNPEP